MSERRGKSPAQLDREIAEALVARRSGARKPSADRGDPLSMAAGVVTGRVRDDDAYQRGWQEVIRAAVEAVGPLPTPARLRDLGGLTKIVSDQIDNASTPGLDANLGSAMFPLTPRSQLHREVGALRAEVQQILAAQERP